MGNFLLIGAGAFGKNLALTLSKYGSHVILIDKKPDLMQDITPQIFKTYVMDATDKKTMNNIIPKNLDAAIVCVVIWRLRLL